MCCTGFNKIHGGYRDSFRDPSHNYFGKPCSWTTIMTRWFGLVRDLFELWSLAHLRVVGASRVQELELPKQTVLVNLWIIGTMVYKLLKL